MASVTSPPAGLLDSLLVPTPSRQLLPTLGLVGALVAVVALLLVFRAAGGPGGVGGSGGSPDTSPAATPGAPASSAGAVVGGSPAAGGTSDLPQLPDLSGAVDQGCRPHRASTELTVVTFNIHSAHGGGRVQVGRIGEEIAALDPDVVLLQEVDRHRAKSGYVDMPAVLAGQLGMQYAFGVNMQQGAQQYGTAILSRYPIVSSENTPLANARGRQPRGLLHALLDVEGIALSVYDTHLDFHRGTLKLRQVQQVAAVVGADPRPRILGGDLNSKPGSPVVTTALGVGTDPWPLVGRGDPATSPAYSPVGRIDWLLHAGEGLTPLSASVGSTAVSDHRPVRTTYRLEGAAGCPVR